MALILAKPTDFGKNVLATYWNIHNLSYSKTDQSVTVTLAGYADKEAANDGSAPLMTVQTNLRGESYPVNAEGVSFKAIYEAIKAAPEWNTAEID